MKTNILKIYFDPIDSNCSIAEYDNGEIDCLEGSHYIGCGKGLRDTVKEALNLWGLSLDNTTVLVERGNGKLIEW